MDKKYHKKHFEDQDQHTMNKIKKRRLREVEENDFGFDEDEDFELYQEVKRYLK